LLNFSVTAQPAFDVDHTIRGAAYGRKQPKATKKAVKKIEKDVRKAVKKGVTEAAIEDAVESGKTKLQSGRLPTHEQDLDDD